MTSANTNQAARVLIVDEDPVVCDSIAALLDNHGFESVTAFSGREALDVLDDAGRALPDRPPQRFDVVIANLGVSGRTSDDLLREIRESHPETVVLVVTAYATVESAVKAIKQGAFDYLTHPLIEEELVLVVQKAASHGALLAENDRLKRQLDARFGLDNLIGTDARMVRVYELIEAVAPTRTTVLMTGESGSGKTLVAKAIHRRSQIANGPFVSVSCGSIPETLLESELFGHVKGAFTGAHADKMGRFLAADGGTLFLDEINSASAAMQLKLLRVLQEKRFEPVGSNETVEVDVRVVLASNQALEQLVEAGEFRQDLYYRINVVKIELPALRERSVDIPLLAEHFLDQYATEMSRQIAGFSDEAMARLQAYPYPGNVRELENIVQRAVVLCQRGMIGVDDLPPSVVQNEPNIRIAEMGASGTDVVAWQGETLAQAMEIRERQIILEALDANEWNRQQTAEQLGVNRTTLYKKIKAYGLEDLHRAG